MNPQCNSNSNIVRIPFSHEAPSADYAGSPVFVSFGHYARCVGVVDSVTQDNDTLYANCYILSKYIDQLRDANLEIRFKSDLSIGGIFDVCVTCLAAI